MTGPWSHAMSTTSHLPGCVSWIRSPERVRRGNSAQIEYGTLPVFRAGAFAKAGDGQIDLSPLSVSPVAPGAVRRPRRSPERTYLLPVTVRDQRLGRSHSRLGNSAPSNKCTAPVLRAAIGEVLPAQEGCPLGRVSLLSPLHLSRPACTCLTGRGTEMVGSAVTPGRGARRRSLGQADVPAARHRA
jgi:hypothetical protein